MVAALSPPRILPSGDAAITVEFSRTIDEEANRRVLALDKLVASAGLAAVTETVPTYRSLLVHYDPLQIGFDALGEKLTELALQPLPKPRRPGAGASRSPMAAKTASISKTSRRRSTSRRTKSSHAMWAATTRWR